MCLVTHIAKSDYIHERTFFSAMRDIFGNSEKKSGYMRMAQMDLLRVRCKNLNREAIRTPVA